MKYSDYTTLLSSARMSKYIKACNGDKAKAISLYHYNIQLSERMFAVINMFEIILRNTIAKHYSLIIKYMTAMGLDVKSVLYRIESPKAIIARINKVF